jgi:hypothetical protein
MTRVRIPKTTNGTSLTHRVASAGVKKKFWIFFPSLLMQIALRLFGAGWVVGYLIVK